MTWQQFWGLVMIACYVGVVLYLGVIAAKTKRKAKEPKR
jgi:hypothetical protein